MFMYYLSIALPMEEILKAFDRYPSQKDVVRVMLKLGLSVKDNNAFCGNG